MKEGLTFPWIRLNIVIGAFSIISTVIVVRIYWKASS